MKNSSVQIYGYKYIVLSNFPEALLEIFICVGKLDISTGTINKQFISDFQNLINNYMHWTRKMNKIFSLNKNNKKDLNILYSTHLVFRSTLSTK